MGSNRNSAPASPKVSIICISLVTNGGGDGIITGGDTRLAA